MSARRCSSTSAGTSAAVGPHEAAVLGSHHSIPAAAHARRRSIPAPSAIANRPNNSDNTRVGIRAVRIIPVDSLILREK